MRSPPTTRTSKTACSTHVSTGPADLYAAGKASKPAPSTLCTKTATAPRNWRHVTAILYLNEGWRSDDGGELVLYPDSARDPRVAAALANQAGRDWTEADRATLAAALAGHRVVEVAPRAGTLVLFDATLVHAVRPSARTRRALTLWLSRVADAPRGAVYDYT